MTAATPSPVCTRNCGAPSVRVKGRGLWCSVCWERQRSTAKRAVVRALECAAAVAEGIVPPERCNGPDPRRVRTTCPHGHPWSVENTAYVRVTHRVCKICRSEQQRRLRANKRRLRDGTA